MNMSTPIHFVFAAVWVYAVFRVGEKSGDHAAGATWLAAVALYMDCAAAHVARCMLWHELVVCCSGAYARSPDASLHLWSAYQNNGTKMGMRVCNPPNDRVPALGAEPKPCNLVIPDGTRRGQVGPDFDTVATTVMTTTCCRRSGAWKHVALHAMQVSVDRYHCLLGSPPLPHGSQNAPWCAVFAAK